jgi:maleate isomerase
MTDAEVSSADLSGTATFGPPEAVRGVGVIAPFDFALDDEYWRWVGPGVTLYITRTPYADLPVSVTMAEAVASLPEVSAAARSLRAASPASLLYACTSGSFVNGLAGERALRQAMADAAGAPAVTTSGALLGALAALGAGRVAIGTPYDEEVTARLRSFLAAAGCSVTGCAYLGLESGIARVDAGTVVRLALAADRPEADAVFLSCTNLRTFGLIADLEQRLGKPVLSANQVSLWAALRAGGLPAAPSGQRLFQVTAAAGGSG